MLYAIKSAAEKPCLNNPINNAAFTAHRTQYTLVSLVASDG